MLTQATRTSLRHDLPEVCANWRVEHTSGGGLLIYTAKATVIPQHATPVVFTSILVLLTTSVPEPIGYPRRSGARARARIHARTGARRLEPPDGLLAARWILVARPPPLHLGWQPDPDSSSLSTSPRLSSSTAAEYGRRLDLEKIFTCLCRKLLVFLGLRRPPPATSSTPCPDGISLACSLPTCLF